MVEDTKEVHCARVVTSAGRQMQWEPLSTCQQIRPQANTSWNEILKEGKLLELENARQPRTVTRGKSVKGCLK